jgi:hypothetical protein
VERGLRVDVTKGDNLVILIDPLGGDFTFHNLAEQTIHTLLSSR